MTWLEGQGVTILRTQFEKRASWTESQHEVGQTLPAVARIVQVPTKNFFARYSLVRVFGVIVG